MSSSPQPLPRPVVTSPRGRRLRALHGRALALAAAVAGRLPPVRYSRWGLAAVAVLGVLGILNLDGTPVHLFDLDAEGTVPAAYSAGLLVAAVLRWRLDETDPAAWAWPMGVALAGAPVIYPWYLLYFTPFLFTTATLPLAW